MEGRERRREDEKEKSEPLARQQYSHANLTEGEHFMAYTVFHFRECVDIKVWPSSTSSGNLEYHALFTHGVKIARLALRDSRRAAFSQPAFHCIAAS